MIIADIGSWVSGFLTANTDAISFLIIIGVFGGMVLSAYTGDLG